MVIHVNILIKLRPREPDILPNWLKFLQNYSDTVRGISKDTWNMLLNFSKTVALSSSYTDKSLPTVSIKFKSIFHVSLEIPRTVSEWLWRNFNQFGNMAGSRGLNTSCHRDIAMSIGRQRNSELLKKDKMVF